MNRYKLSAFITISDLQDEYDEVPAAYKENHHLLYDSQKDREILINNTVKYFIEKFSSPKTSEELITEVKIELKNNSADIDNTCTEFFSYLIKKNILVPEETIEEVIEKATYLQPEDVFENYKVETLLSDRGYLEIYLVTDTNNGGKSVIKLLNKGKTDDPDVYNDELFELEREYEMMKSVEPIPAMCQVYSFTKTELYAFIHLEYIEGLSILRYLKNTPGLVHEDCLKIIHDFLTGFGAMHESGIIHGDIHSSNILITSSKDARIIDLGYARKLDLQENEVLPFGGVLHYMPPERINISSMKKYAFDADLYSDVYQIGMLMYLVLYRDFPFNGFIWEELAKNIKETKEQYAALSFLNYSVEDDLKKIIQKCLSKNPAERYKNAGEILQNFKTIALQKELIVN